MIISKLYSSDDGFFRPIKFKNGFNVILGERSQGSEKRNGVGKSISIEFINFCLLKDLDKSRLRFLPKPIIAESSPIFLDVEFEGNKVTIKRDLKKPNVVVIYDGVLCSTLDLEDARKYLLSKLKFSKKNLFSSFRSLVNPLTRDERCEFKSIPSYSDTNLNVPINYTSHFFYLGLDDEPLNNAMHIKSNILTETTVKRKVTKQVETLLGKSIKESKVEYNKLKEECDNLQKIVDEGDCSAFDILDDEYQSLEIELQDIRIKLSSLRVQILQAKRIVNEEVVDTENVRVIYEKVRSGLGDSVSRSINEVVSFKNKINKYTNNVVLKKVETINNEISTLKERRDFLLSERAKYDKGTESSKFEYDFKEVISKLAIKKEMLNGLSAYLKKIDDLDTKIKSQKIDLDKEKLDIEVLLKGNADVLQSFEKNILKAHFSIFDDYSSSFKVNVNNRKEIVDFELRVKEDGSHSNERAKVFIYDFSLLTHKHVYSNHLGFLIHDNIFDNDNDTLEKSLNFIYDSLVTVNNDAQYILTLNSDKLAGLDLGFTIDDYVRASFTKDNKFLKQDYKEDK
ncbi:DUF2326 domain-containing protein [Vibrio lentus]|uniref:DUF2326 domain-containing protein n=1 Tax=Vibrio lentus TaxID=136468 RepID=UPI000C82AA9B|nr:DUF2326 domain-containing protein [Vibrio lentus]PMH90429.1 hypothetical protein BCU56_17220 [Vibrio lentus]PMI58271.1 hypothetical protein BCU41_23825 [Vibrio lentus]